MHILRRGGSGLLLALFQLLLFVFPVVLALALLLHSPDFIKQTIKDSGTYNQLVPALLDQSEKQVAQDGGQQAADLLKDQGLRDAIAKSFKGGQIENASGQAIDGFYAWLQGKTPTPEFTIDLTPSRQAFIDNMNQYALDRAKSLPTCNLQQLRELQGQSSINVLEAPCLPPGISPASAANQFTQEAVNNSEFLANPVISSSDLKDANGQSAFAAADWVPQAYQGLMWAPWIIGGLLLMTGVGTILLHDERWRAVRRTAITLLITGILLFLGSAAYWLLSANIDQLVTGVAADMQAMVSKIMATSFGSYVQTVALTGGAYAVLGAAGLIASRFMKAKATSAPIVQPETNTTPAAPATQSTDISATPTTTPVANTPGATTPTTETATTKEDSNGTPKP